MLTHEKDKISGKYIKELREKRLNLTQEKFAQFLGISLRTVSRWEQEESSPEPYLEEKLIRLRKIADKLVKMKGKNITEWLQTPRREFHGQPPIDLIGSEFGYSELSHAIQEWAEEGAPS